MSDVRGWTAQDIITTAAGIGLPCRQLGDGRWQIGSLVCANSSEAVVYMHGFERGRLDLAYPSTCTGQGLQECLLEDLTRIARERLTPESRMRLREGIRRIDG